MPKGDSGNECGGNRNNGVTIVGKKGKSKDYWVIRPAAREVARIHLRARSERFTPCQTHCPVLPEDLSSCRTTHWYVADSNEAPQTVHDHWADPHVAHEHISVPTGKYWIGETVFQLAPHAVLPSGTEHEVMLNQWTPKQARQVSQHFKHIGNKGNQPKPFDVIEVFSPPRFAKQAAVRGIKCLSADYYCLDGIFETHEHREHMKRLIRETPPELLIPVSAMHMGGRMVQPEPHVHVS